MKKPKPDRNNGGSEEYPHGVPRPRAEEITLTPEEEAVSDRAFAKLAHLFCNGKPGDVTINPSQEPRRTTMTISKPVKYFHAGGSIRTHLNVNETHLWLGEEKGKRVNPVSASSVIGAEYSQHGTSAGGWQPEVVLTFKGADGSDHTLTMETIGFARGGDAQELIAAINAIAKGRAVAATPGAGGAFCSGCGAPGTGAFCAGCGQAR